MKTVYIERNKLFKSLQMLLCNEITNADESFIEDNMDLFYQECEECKGSGEKDGVKCEECYGEGRFDSEVYQYFLTRLDDWEKKRLTSYGVLFGYSEKLQLSVIPVYDYGTSWSCFSYSKEVADDYELRFDETLIRSTVY